MNLVKVSILITVLMNSFFAFSQDASSNGEKHTLQFESDKLNNSTMVTVAGKKVPMIVVTEIQKICDRKGLSIKDCNRLVETGCTEFTKVYEEKNIKTIEIPVKVDVVLHIHEHTHHIHKEQKKYTYNYEVRVQRSSSESHEHIELPPIHEQGIVEYVQQEKEGCELKPSYEHQSKKHPNGFGKVLLPSCFRLSHDIAIWAHNNHIRVKIYVLTDRIEFIGPDAGKLASVVFNFFPQLRDFDLATNDQVRRLFETLDKEFNR